MRGSFDSDAARQRYLLGRGSWAACGLSSALAVGRFSLEGFASGGGWILAISAVAFAISAALVRWGGGQRYRGLLLPVTGWAMRLALRAISVL